MQYLESKSLPTFNKKEHVRPGDLPSPMNPMNPMNQPHDDARGGAGAAMCSSHTRGQTPLRRSFDAARKHRRISQNTIAS